MVFITAGMGGGTGTGAAPVIARIARESGVLTVGVVTKPFQFEGVHRMRVAESGIEELQKYVDTLIIIPNQNLFRIANERTTFAEKLAGRMRISVVATGIEAEIVQQEQGRLGLVARLPDGEPSLRDTGSGYTQPMLTQNAASAAAAQIEPQGEPPRAEARGP